MNAPCVAYVAGIYSTKTNSPKVRARRLKRINRFCVALAKIGILSYSPLHDTSWDANEGHMPYEFFIYGDLTKMRRACDIALFTPGWEKSDGCRIEHIFAKKLGIPVFYSIQEIQDWMRVKPRVRYWRPKKGGK